MIRAIALACLMVVVMQLFGCYASLDGFNNNVVKGGPTINYMKKISCEPVCVLGSCTTCPDWDNPSYYRDNGNPVFCEGKPKCQTHWEVDRKSQRIVRWRVEARSGDYWSRNHCDFVPPPGRSFSPWYSGLGNEGHAEEEAGKSCFSENGVKNSGDSIEFRGQYTNFSLFQLPTSHNCTRRCRDGQNTSGGCSGLSSSCHTARQSSAKDVFP